MKPDDKNLVKQAQTVLDFNWTGEYTKPGPRLYPHQWSWDSALIAIGYSRYDGDRATKELAHLLDAQWKNGLLPQIVFNPRVGTYFPGTNFWHADKSPNAPAHVKTSGIVQPPLHATAALHVHKRAGDPSAARKFLERAFPRLAAWHEYLYRERDPEGEGLVYIRHPWESGMDNSPMWDSIMERSSSAPTRSRSTSGRTYTSSPPRTAPRTPPTTVSPTSSSSSPIAIPTRPGIRTDCPFLVQDVLFNALLSQAGRDLAEIAQTLGRDPSPFD